MRTWRLPTAGASLRTGAVISIGGAPLRRAEIAAPAAATGTLLGAASRGGLTGRVARPAAKAPAKTAAHSANATSRARMSMPAASQPA